MKDGLIAAFSIVCAVILALCAIYFLRAHPDTDKAENSSCAVGQCPLELREENSGGTYTYTLTSRIGVVLDERSDPKEHLACTPSSILGPISNIPAVAPPLYAVRYEAIAIGSCTLKDDHFRATINVVAN